MNDFEVPTALERKIEIRNEFYHEAPRYRQAISIPMKVFVLERIDHILDEYNTLGRLAIAQPPDDPTAA